MDITAEQAASIFEGQSAARKTMSRRQRYYDGKHDIVGRNERYKDDTRKSERVTNWCRYIVDSYVGAMTSVPVQVVSADEDGGTIDEYLTIARDNALPQYDVELVRTAAIMGNAVELHSFVDSGIVITVYDPRDWAIVNDSDGEMQAAIWTATLEPGTVHRDEFVKEELRLMTIYTDAQIAEYEQRTAKGADTWKQISVKSHGYGQPPVVVWTLNPDGKSLLADDIIGLNDEYNETDSASGDSIRRAIGALLAISGVDPDWLLSHASEIRQQGVLPLGDNLKGSSDAKYLTPGQTFQETDARLARTRHAIHMASGVPDIESIVGATGVASGLALKLKFLPMIQKASAMFHYFEAAIRHRIDLINAVNQRLKGETVDGYKVNTTFYLPVNRLDEWEKIKNLDGIVSHKTQLELLTDIEDPEAELARIEAERETAPGMAEKRIATAGEKATVAAGTVEEGMGGTVQQIGAGTLEAFGKTGALERIAGARQR